MKWTEGRSKAALFLKLQFERSLPCLSRFFSLVAHKVRFLVPAIFNPNPWKIRVCPRGRSTAALRKICVAPHNYLRVSLQNRIPRKKVSFPCHVPYITKTIHYYTFFLFTQITQYVSPEGSIVEQVFTCLRNLEQSSSCSNLASQCHAQPVAIYSNMTHFHVGHID